MNHCLLRNVLPVFYRHDRPSPVPAGPRGGGRFARAAGLRAGQLATILAQYEPEPLPVQLVYDAQGMVPQKLRAFLDFAVPRLRTTLQDLPK